MTRSYSGSITRLGDRHYRVRVTVGYDEHGRQVRASESVHGTRADAERVRERLNRQKGADSVTYGRTSVYDFVKDEWLPTRKLRSTTLRGYNATLENHIRPAFANVKMKDLTALHVIRALNAIENKGAALNVYKMLHAALTLAANTRIIDHNPMLSVDKPEVPDYDAEVYTLDELLAVLEWARGADCEAGVIIAAVCGTRASETCALDWRDVTLIRERIDGKTRYSGSVDIFKGYHRVNGVRMTTGTKTKRSSRMIGLPDFAVQRLLELRGVGPLMVDRTSQRMTPEGFSQRWRRLMLPRQNAEGVTTYQPPVRFIPLKNLRHSRATVSLDLGIDLHRVSPSMGHERESTTDTIYNKPQRVPDQTIAAVWSEAVRRRSAGA